MTPKLTESLPAKSEPGVMHPVIACNFTPMESYSALPLSVGQSIQRGILGQVDFLAFLPGYSLGSCLVQ